MVRDTETPRARREREVEDRLRALMADPLYWRRRDPDFVAHVGRQFDRVFGTGPVRVDATGRMIQPQAVRFDLEPFRPKARPDDIRVEGAVGSGRANRPDDVVRLKRGLAGAGLLDFDPIREPSERAGEDLAGAVRRFQKAKGLKVDGIVEPKGPTAKALAARLFGEGGGATADGREIQTASVSARGDQAAPGSAETRPADGAGLAGELGRNKGRRPPGGETEGGEVQTAAVLAPLLGATPAGARVLIGILGALGAGKLAEDLRKFLGETEDGEGKTAVDAPLLEALTDNPRLLIETLRALGAGKIAEDFHKFSGKTDDPPPMPPSPAEPPKRAEPPRDFDPEDARKLARPNPGFPAEAPVMISDAKGPIPIPVEPQVQIFPADESFWKDLPIVHRKGNAETKAHLDHVRDKILEHNPGWDHTDGGRRQEDGTEMPEFRVPGPGIALEDDKGRPGDSRPGSHFTDLTFKTKSGRIVHVQTVDVDKHGKPTDRELEVARKIHRITGHDVILIAKPRRAR